jgi:hypothetical protein
MGIIVEVMFADTYFQGRFQNPIIVSMDALARAPRMDMMSRRSMKSIPPFPET